MWRGIYYLGVGFVVKVKRERGGCVFMSLGYDNYGNSLIMVVYLLLLDVEGMLLRP